MATNVFAEGEQGVILQPYTSTQSDGAMKFISSGPFLDSGVINGTLLQVGSYLPIPVKFTKNYNLIYKVDGVDYKTYEVKYGTTITPEAAPIRDGYTFSGWSEIPATMPAHDVTVTGTFTYAGATATVTISSVGQGTYCYNQDLDFTDVDGIKAYVASGFNPSDGNILLMRVKEVPAGTGLLVKGNAGIYTIPVKDTQFYYLNMFKPVFAATAVATEEDGNTNYVLANGSEGLKFYKSSGASLSANRAYLQIPTSLLGNHSNARSIGYTLDDEEGTTAINSINEDTDEDALYNLKGQHVTTPRKGIYVRNGKKIFVNK